MKKIMLGIMVAMLVLTVSSVSAYSDDDVAYCKKVMSDYYGTTEGGSEPGYNGATTSNAVNAVAVDPNYADTKASIKLKAADTATNVGGGGAITLGIPERTDDESEETLRRRAFAAQKTGFLDDCDDNCRAEARPATTVDDRTEVTRTDRVRFLGFELDAVSTVEVDSDEQITERRSNFARYLFERGWAKKVN